MNARARAGVSLRLIAGCSLLPSAAAGQGFELAIQGGPALPTYKQTFTFKGGSPQIGLVRLTQVQSPSLDAEGGLALGGSASFYLLGSLGLEARIDSVDVDLRSFSGAYQVQVGSSGPATLVTLGSATTDLARVRPISLNVKVQGNRRLSMGFSTGLSTISSASVNPTPQASAGARTMTVPLALEARPSKDRLWGVNGGLSMRLKVMQPLSVFGEVRGFAFRKSDWTWGVNPQNLPSGLSSQAATALATALEAPAFTPGFWTGSVGVAITFR
jgi:hypothetical protein